VAKAPLTSKIPQKQVSALKPKSPEVKKPSFNTSPKPGKSIAASSSSNTSGGYKFPSAVEESLQKYCKNEASLSSLKIDTKKYASGQMDGKIYLGKLKESVGGNMNTVALDVIGSLPKGEPRRALAQLYSQQWR